MKVNLIKGASQKDLNDAVDLAKLYRDETEVLKDSVSTSVSDIHTSEVNALLYANNASASATSALNSANTATTKANEASNSALSANNSATSIIGIETTVLGYKSDTLTYRNETEAFKNTASSKASEASISASNALASANNASTSKDNALAYSNNAQTYMNNAQTYASDASNSKDSASLSATSASNSKDQALVYRNESSVYASQSLTNANNATIQANISKDNAVISTTQAGIATTKASEASTSANQALTYKNEVMSYVIPSGTSYSVDQLNTKYSAITKAQFNALADERRANRAGSGFDNFGKGSSATTVNVNEGIWTDATQANRFYIGKTTSNSGSSITNDAQSVVNGVLQKLQNINNGSLSIADIILPTAPTIYPSTVTLTAEQIASGVIKHADSSNSGLVISGKGLSGTTFSQTVIVVNGKKYIIEYVDNSVRKTLEVTASSTTYNISLSGANITEVGMYPTDAISRSDLVFLESWHEDISEKNFVYPLGNVQYLGSNTDGLTGIANGAFTGFETYSLFGNWQAPSALIGKGYILSSLTEAQKKLFLANKDNNCYLDGDKVIQVRYRMRVVQGLGDTWDNVDAQNTSSLNYLRYNNSARVSAKGKSVSILSDIGSSATDDLYRTQQNMISTYTKDYGYGLFSVNPNSSTYSYEGKCFALPIALVHRRNQGMYHPVYNANGTKKASDNNFWYNTAISFTSISDCFDPAKLLTASGYIGTVSGRPDGLFYDQVHEGDIIDLRNSSKKVEDYSRLREKEFNKLVAGTNRGKEGEWAVIKSGDYTTSGNNYLTRLGAGSTRIDYSGNPASLLTNSTLFADAGRTGTYIKGSNGNYYRVIEINVSAGNNMAVYLGHEYGDVRSVFVVGTYNLVISDKTTRTKSNTLLNCDIIGNPTNYPTVWKQSGVFGTPLLVAEDGTSLLPTGSLTAFKVSRKSNATPLLVLKSTDSGATWSALTVTTHYTFSTTTNTITMVTAPATTDLIMVYYQTHTSMAVPAVNNEVLEIGDVFACNGTYSSQGSVLANTLIGKTPISIVVPVSMYKGKPMGYKFYNSPIDKLDIVAGYEPIHPTVSGFGTTVSPTIKVFPYLTRLNGKAYLNLVFKEMKHNGTSWGDDSKFNIVDNVSTTTDNNAQTVLIGQKTVELPYFIAGDE